MSGLSGVPLSPLFLRTALTVRDDVTVVRYIQQLTGLGMVGNVNNDVPECVEEYAWG